MEQSPDAAAPDRLPPREKCPPTHADDGVAASLQGAPVTTFDLARVITLKTEVGGDKDLATLPILRHTLEERRKEPGSAQQE